MGTALIAVIGTLLGSVATHLFQRQAADRTAALARAEQLRQERISAYSAFAGALVDYRRAQNDRWHRKAEAPDSADAKNSRLDSYPLRSSARQALIRVQLVCADREAVRLAQDALEFTHSMHGAADEPERARRSEQAKEALDGFIDAAAPSVR
ncbi:hypothetical protein AR457_25995 [Streptomyces agglomeratus]|uniref:Protein kilB n=1 Tax=Streptomyces agglomeratus TaxID=285458 RepID=A0A1E5PD09_9ACTN|nr:hypothetical protein [Streptomyces agglomeratus]OEJ27397.1 hypothetical protein AS594_25870 [Streptomyces agglomeratus]OEJ38547.1 hypothetical protein BGK70_10660 [Streptomyces agglomeratus]OEJ47068.1 hypothetical protein AR457_25995 [Streptomyces agglomeratus]OEJ51075.1 hypothetical protein BGK72_10145 [Streptomyces agglomeratus]